MGLFDRLREVVTSKTVSVPLLAIREMLNRQLPKIANLDVNIKNGYLMISDYVFLFIPVHIKLKPLHATGRQVVFEVVSFGPLNFEFLKKRLFHNSAMCNYENKQLTIDFDNLSMLKKIPLLKIKSVELGERSVKFQLDIK